MHCFQLVFQLTFYLVSKFIIDFNWYQKYKMFYFHWYLKNFIYIQVVSQNLFCWLKRFQNLFYSNFKFFWYELPICKRSLTSLLYIDSCWVYLVLRSLTSLLYVIYVYRGALYLHLCIVYYALCELGHCPPFFM